MTCMLANVPDPGRKKEAQERNRSVRDTLLSDARKWGWKVERDKVRMLTLSPLSSAERYLTLNKLQHVELEHWVLDFQYSFQNRLLV